MSGCAWDRQLAWVGLVCGAALALGCNQFIGLEEVSLVDDAGVDARDTPDASVDARVDAPVDTGPTNLFLFVTDTASSGGFGVGEVARMVADARCEDKYNADFPDKGCANIHAVLQVDDNDDSLARMEINFSIPDDLEVLRAIDDTPVAANWNVVVDPNLDLLAPVTDSATEVFFWSGRASVADRHCNSWTSEASDVFGSAGDATVSNSSWTARAVKGCNDIDQRLLCVCF